MAFKSSVRPFGPSIESIDPVDPGGGGKRDLSFPLLRCALSAHSFSEKTGLSPGLIMITPDVDVGLGHWVLDVFGGEHE
jgi:hypothetical protein